MTRRTAVSLVGRNNFNPRLRELLLKRILTAFCKMQPDIELADMRKLYINGYPSLAAFIFQDRDKSTAIYRRFDRLSARNLLYLQSELVELETKQDEYDAEDLEDNGMEAKQCARCWSTFAQKAAQGGREREKERMAVVKKVRETIKNTVRNIRSSQKPSLGEALIPEHAFLNLNHPNPRQGGFR